MGAAYIDLSDSATFARGFPLRLARATCDQPAPRRDSGHSPSGHVVLRGGTGLTDEQQAPAVSRREFIVNLEAGEFSDVLFPLRF